MPTVDSGTREVALPHSVFEDGFALASGGLMIGLGLYFLKNAGLLTSGLSGAAFLLHYATGWDTGLSLFLLNLPFFALAWATLGTRFSLKSFGVVALISLMLDHLSAMFVVGQLHPGFAAVAGGVLIGIGLLALFRHGASVGGTSSLALHLQRRRGWPAGRVLMSIDAAIFMVALAVVDPKNIAWSITSALILNLMVTLNHRPGRYMTC
ncbi:YitT family protein [Variovorax sp. J22G21]|uniref:YitT family protein n=1 Tax=Variovorax fucosicus TaxID=3053517 RepID=UPI0025765C2F|nr:MULTISPECIES: YitT family protein [unclassified Variovorax]MDM0039988.1 YitT family protein [Variovorax sp. J22R193]MDM0054188.1 YitT family protein [Variovorax sp. J22G47]MDM0061361.1 YitT family protein [Variovorax sp. J22G21]